MNDVKLDVVRYVTVHSGPRLLNNGAQNQKVLLPHEIHYDARGNLLTVTQNAQSSATSKPAATRGTPWAAVAFTIVLWLAASLFIGVIIRIAFPPKVTEYHPDELDLNIK